MVDRGHLRGHVGKVAHSGLAWEEARLGPAGLACFEALAAAADMKELQRDSMLVARRKPAGW